jgi:pyruvate dehydrogenase E2 component (dihydrolipoamide acetyltransferase)
MPYEVVMPQLGLSMEEGSVTGWVKQLGEWVEKGEVLFTVQTDKVEMEVEVAHSGYLRTILVQLGETVPVGRVIATLSDQPTNTTYDVHPDSGLKSEGEE